MEVGLERIKIPLRDGVELEVEFTELLREQIRSFYSLSKDASVTPEHIHSFLALELKSALDRL